MIVFFVQFAGERHADPDRQTMAEGAGGHVDSRGFIHIRVPLKDAAHPTQRRQMLLIEIATFGQGGIPDRAGMTFGKDEAVPIRPFRIFRIDAHQSESKAP